jgi:membrane protease YdiL (CAAX protease family)
MAFLPGVTRKEGPSAARTLEHGGEVALSAARTPGKKPAENLGSPFSVIMRTILIFVASQAAGFFIVDIIYGLVRPGRSPDLNNSITGQFFYILIAEALAAWLAIMLVRGRGLKLSAIGLGRRPKVNDLWRAGLGFAAFYALLIVAGVITNQFSPDINKQQQNLGFTNITNGTENLLAFISLVILPPLGEETLVRGYLYSGLRKAWRFWPAVLVTSLIFGAAHLEFGSGGPLVWAAALDTFILSIVLCFLRERTGALYAGMLVHMLNNLIAFGVHFK